MRAIIWAAVSTKKQAAEGKGSIEDQLREARELCYQKGWTVIDELVVPGFSRNYIDIHEFAKEAYEKEGIDAGVRLLKHFDDNDFDVFVVRDTDRFGRTQTLLSYIIEMTVRVIKGTVYTIENGEIDSNNLRLGIAIGGFRAAGEIDNLRKKQQIGYRAKVKQGLPMNANVCRSHKIIRDESSGKVVGVEIDESRRQEFLDLASLVLEGVAWSRIEREMYDQFGYARNLPGGGAQSPFTYYRILYTPSFWGHIALKGRGKLFAPWSREEGHKVPEGVTVHYNAFEPMYTGELAEQIKSELTRREQIKGRQRPRQSYKLSGLIICAECGYRMTYFRTGNYHGIRCNSRWMYAGNRPTCNSHKTMNERDAIPQINEYLMEVLEHGSLDTLIGDSNAQDLNSILDNVERDIAALTDKIATMIHKQSEAPETTREIYDDQIREAAKRLDILKKRQQDLNQSHTITQSAKRGQKQAIKEIKELGPKFWDNPNNKINQLLLRVFSTHRFVCQNGEIKGLVPLNSI